MAEPKLHAFLFPGIVFHEFSHYLACLLFGVRVKRVQWFGLDEAFVVHEVPKPLPSVIITLAPFLLGNWLGFLLLETANSLLGAGALLASFNPLLLLYYWFAVALLYYSFPSDQDGSNAFHNMLSTYKEKIFGPESPAVKLLYILTFPFVFLPLAFVLGFMMLFSNSAGLRILWVLAALFLSYDPGLSAQFTHLFDGLLSGLTRLFIGV